MEKIYIPYVRVSDIKQEDGYSLEWQMDRIRTYVNGDGTLLDHYEEIETATNKKKQRRPVLREALKKCQDTAKQNPQAQVVLILAKLDRLARDTAFCLSVLDTPGVEVRFCDFPDGNRFVITLMAAVAEYEGNQISQRTKAGLAVLKKKGVKLGIHTHKTKIEYFPKEIREKAIIVRQQIAKEDNNNVRAYSVVRLLKGEGKNWTQIAKYLNENGFTTRNLNAFSGKTTKDLYNLYK